MNKEKEDIVKKMFNIKITQPLLNKSWSWLHHFDYNETYKRKCQSNYCTFQVRNVGGGRFWCAIHKVILFSCLFQFISKFEQVTKKLTLFLLSEFKKKGAQCLIFKVEPGKFLQLWTFKLNMYQTRELPGIFYIILGTKKETNFRE